MTASDSLSVSRARASAPPRPSRMLRIPMTQVDAFCDTVFAGNPAAVCLLEGPQWLPDHVMQSIAAENNLSETAFVLPGGFAGGADQVHPAGDIADETPTRLAVRWFTPTAEVDLCGHATMAAACTWLQERQPVSEGSTVKLVFGTRAVGDLEVTYDDSSGRYTLDLPAAPPVVVDEPPAGLQQALGQDAPTPQAIWQGRKTLVVFEHPSQIEALKPNLEQVAAVCRQGMICTAPAPGNVHGEADFVSRYFAPHVGIPEDPVTGSAHCTLVPYWAHRLAKQQLVARQISARGGTLWCEHVDSGAESNSGAGRVRLSGQATLYFSGMIRVPVGNEDHECDHDEHATSE